VAQNIFSYFIFFLNKTVGWVEQLYRDTHHRCVQMMGIAEMRSTHPTSLNKTPVSAGVSEQLCSKLSANARVSSIFESYNNYQNSL
jgi:hypothetical protein